MKVIGFRAPQVNTTDTRHNTLVCIAQSLS